MPRTWIWERFVLAAAAAVMLACSGAGVGDGDGESSTAPAPVASVAAAAPSVTATAAPAGAPTGTVAGTVAGLRTLGAMKFADRGTASAVGKTELTVAVEDFAFSPTFVQGAPGQKITLQLTNDTATTHNLSVEEQGIDRALPAKSKTTVELTVPESGALLFFCRLHSATGTNGELLAGSSTPTAVGAPAAAATAKAGDDGY